MYMGSIILSRSMHITETDTTQMPTLGSKRRAPVYKFARFSEKLHEIKKMLVRRGAPPLDPPLQLQSGIQDCVCVCGGGGCS